jgi:hypothetical protein
MMRIWRLWECKVTVKRMRIGPISQEDEIGYPEALVLYLVHTMDRHRHGIGKDILDEQAMTLKVHWVPLPD